ncbi:DNA repair protein RadA [Flavobacteriaceae bacterium]|jgi:DNA repair protein RadA/Sms|nr:DNA repair protein RadA [Flavobacteriaceae bacterium]MDA9551036.1 DNA repair protein RadA [Flavobacteriaceae bacterium]MDA9849657.1 DNA repair protein RadA [Flavobacteriaceae bacterium]MDB2322173.1 DNA repair protein RadA [Flavobacteriaceae bacterium]
MSKVKTTFICNNCGTNFPKWQGQCTSCKSWNSISEEVILKTNSNSWETETVKSVKSNTPQKISNIVYKEEDRLVTSDTEFNRVLGGGIVPGSLTLLGGEPGIGKSTLLLQIAIRLPYSTLYVSGEESQSQIKMRANRMNYESDDCYVLTEISLESIFKQIQKTQPQILIIDSIQTLKTELVDSAPGSVSQIKTCTSELINFAKKTATPVIIIGHITKDGNIAGPKILEHMVDTVLQFEGDRNHVYRILRVNKNRFGSTNEIGVYEMNIKGLKEITNPSEILISKKNQELSGNAISATIEGMRPFMIEVQALVSTAVYGTPQRSSTGYNSKRLNMLLAVLEKRVGFRLASKDVFLNITGGISVDDTALDLAIVAAIISSNEDLVLNEKYCFAAEVGLSGEIRPVQRLEQRIAEAEKLGFSKIFISKFSKLNISTKSIKIIFLSKIEDLINNLN